MFVSQIYDEASEILATTDQTKIFRKLTQAVQTLMESGHYFHLNQEVDVCTGWDGQTITLPRGIEVPLGVNVDGSPQYFRGRLFQYNVNKGGMYNPVDWSWDDRGFVSTIMDIRQPSQLIAIAEHSADAGLSLRVVGTDSNNRELRSQSDAGVGLDGLIVPVHAQSDFPLGSIIPDGVTIQTRSVSVSPLGGLTSSTAHQLQAGQGVILSISGTTPPELVNGNTYYVDANTSTTTNLYNTSIDAQNGTNPVQVSSIIGTTSATLTDSRNIDLYTTVNLASAPAISIDSPNEVTFSGTLPTPLVTGTTYFAQPQDSTNLLIYNSLSDAQNNVNPVALRGSTASYNVDIRKDIAPETTLVFSVPHYYSSGDEVQAFTSGGTLPSPLVAGQNYFVNVIDTLTISLHTTQADANASTATSLVNPITFTDVGVGTNSVVKLISATSTTGQSGQITAGGLSIPTPTGTGAAASAVVTGSVTNYRLLTGGSNYSSAPIVQFASPPSPPTGTSQQAIPATGYAVMVPDAVGSSTYAVGSIVITNAGAGYINTPAITIAPPTTTIKFTGNTTSGSNTISSLSSTTGLVVGQQLSGPNIPSGSTIASIGTTSLTITKNATATATTQSFTAGSVFGFTCSTTSGSPNVTSISSTSGLTVGQAIYSAEFPADTTLVSFSGTTAVFSNNATATNTSSNCQAVSLSSANQAQAISVLTTSFVSYFNITNAGTNYVNPPIVNITGGGGSGAVAVASVSNGNLTGISVIAQGTGYTSTPSVTITPSTGVFIEFSSTGSLPSPITSGTAYRLENPNSQTGQFTLLNTDYTPVNIISGGSGTLYVNLSRSFNIGFNSIWDGDFGGLVTGNPVYMASDYVLPTGVSVGTAYYVNKINASKIKLYDTSAHATAGGATGLISITALGVGQAYFAVRSSATSHAYNNLLFPASTQYLTTGELVSFTSSGSLPYPLTAGTSYKIVLAGNQISLTDTSGNAISFLNGSTSTLPVGQMSMNIVRTFTPNASTSIVCTNGILETGDQITVRPNSGDILPSSLVQSTQSANQFYYVRAIGSGLFELYDTEANAINTAYMNGRISYSNVGNSITSTFFVDAVLLPTLVKSILHVEKPITQGYVSLYAYDYGRSNDMALIGQYHPSETNPKYRRIRIGKPCAWARIIYRMAHPEITSVYDYIPVENTRAILAAVHACDLEDKDFFDQSQKYWQVALQYLRSQNESMDGHAMEPIQVNNLVYGDGSDCVMF